MIQARGLALGLMTVFTSLGAYYPESSTSRFYYEVGPFLYKRSSSFYFEFRVAADRPSFTVSLFAYVDKSYKNYYASVEQSYDFSGITGRIGETITIPSTFTKRETFYLAIKLLGHEYGDERLGQVFVYSDGLDVTVGRTYSAYSPSPGERLDTGRTIVRENNALSHIETKQEYAFSSFPGQLANDATNRCLNINRFRLSYKGFNSDDTLETAAAELRILSHLDEFPFSVTHELGGKKYVRIPLNISSVGASTTHEGFTDYSLSLIRTYYYDLRNLNMYSSQTKPNSHCFASQNVFIPQGSGHDLLPCDYELFIWNATYYRDSFLITGRIDFSNPRFGDCETADYCVVYGGPVNA